MRKNPHSQICSIEKIKPYKNIQTNMRCNVIFELIWEFQYILRKSFQCLFVFFFGLIVLKFCFVMAIIGGRLPLCYYIIEKSKPTNVINYFEPYATCVKRRKNSLIKISTNFRSIHFEKKKHLGRTIISSGTTVLNTDQDHSQLICTRYKPDESQHWIQHNIAALLSIPMETCFSSAKTFR